MLLVSTVTLCDTFTLCRGACTASSSYRPIRVVPFLVETASMLNHFSCVQLFVTLWTIAHWAPLSMGFSRHEHWSGLPCPPPGDLPNPGNELMSLIPPVLAGGFFTTSSTWEATVLSVQFSSVAQLYRLFVTP